MAEDLKRKLLKNRQVIEEINRHLWIESEKAGYDIGFDKAANDWIDKYSNAWIKFHMPHLKVAGNTSKAKADSSDKMKSSRTRKNK